MTTLLKASGIKYLKLVVVGNANPHHCKMIFDGSHYMHSSIDSCMMLQLKKAEMFQERGDCAKNFNFLALESIVTILHGKMLSDNKNPDALSCLLWNWTYPSFRKCTTSTSTNANTTSWKTPIMCITKFSNGFCQMSITYCSSNVTLTKICVNKH